MTKPTRIEPSGDGIEINAPAGGAWLRDADGGLTPADQATAHAAGLRWGDEPEEAAVDLSVGSVQLVPAVDQVAVDSGADSAAGVQHQE